MSISSYEKDGVTLWQVYVHVRSKANRKVRFQKRLKDIKSETLALKEERKLTKELSMRVAKAEGYGLKWKEIVFKWEEQALFGHLGNYSKTTIVDYVASMKNWTKCCFNTPASKITRADARQILKDIELAGRTPQTVQRIKNTINMIFNFGIDEGYIKGIEKSPFTGLKVNKKVEKSPDILTLDEVRFFLQSAKSINHNWYPVWLMACLTGMRSGELYALKWDDLFIDWKLQSSEDDFIRVSRSYNKRTREYKSTKAGYWRNVPISDELKDLLIDLKSNLNERETKNAKEFVLPRIRDWERGYQARTLKFYLTSINLKPIKFHALRACFATSLLSQGVPSPVVMKICGWRDLKTMEYYVRVAGVNEKGATQCLKLLDTDKVA